jgi:hypothetical protein
MEFLDASNYVLETKFRKKWSDFGRFEVEGKNLVVVVLFVSECSCIYIYIWKILHVILRIMFYSKYFYGG